MQVIAKSHGWLRTEMASGRASQRREQFPGRQKQGKVLQADKTPACGKAHQGRQ